MLDISGVDLVTFEYSCLLKMKQTLMEFHALFIFPLSGYIILLLSLTLSC